MMFPLKFDLDKIVAIVNAVLTHVIFKVRPLFLFEDLLSFPCKDFPGL
jgi:hypothetical protein